MLKSCLTTIGIIAPLAAGFILVAATDGALARVSTGVRPISAGTTTNVFGIKPGVGKGVGADGGTGIGGVVGEKAPPPRPRPHRPDWPPTIAQ